MTDIDYDEGSWNDEHYGRIETGTPPTVHYINESGLPDEVVFNDDRFMRDVASQVEKWSQSLSAYAPMPTIDVFSRNKWQNSTHPFALMSMCAWAVEHDDVLSTLADVTEGLTFKKVRFELNDDDQQDMWNQWAEDVDLDSRLREQFRDLFKCSQVYVGLWWERKVYSVRDSPINQTVDEMQRVKAAKAAANFEALQPSDPSLPPPPPPVPTAGPGRGNRKRKKKFPVEVPTAMTVFDPTKILPVGTLLFGRERFAYIATDAEDDAFAKALRGDIVDGTVMQLVDRKYEPTGMDLQACQELGVDPTRLWLLKEGAVYRHTLTRAQYERFPAIRLQPALEILDMKKHLRSSDRATLIGNTNFIVVIRKGTDKLPARQPEIDNLQQQARTIARLPVLIGDHRLDVQIVSPSIDNTLAEARWMVLDDRLIFTALRSFAPLSFSASRSSGSGASETSRVVAQGLENRRHQLIRALERYVFKEVMRRNEGVLDETPSLAFAPKRVTLDFSADVIGAVLKLRDRGDISRETSLDEFDFDQDVEVVRRAREQTFYDEVFSSATPYSSPAANPFAPPGQPGRPAPAAADTTPEGGRPPGVKEDGPRQPAGAVKA